MDRPQALFELFRRLQQARSQNPSALSPQAVQLEVPKLEGLKERPRNVASEEDAVVVSAGGFVLCSFQCYSYPKA